MSMNRSVGLQLGEGEIIVQRHKDVEISFKKSKYSCEHLKGTKHGHLYLTNYRMFFVNDKKNDMLQNFSMPFTLIKDFEIKQPVFGANHIEGKVLSEQGGGWQGSAEFEMTFKAGGAVEVGQELVKLAKNPRAMYIAQPTIVFSATPPHPSAPGYGYAPPPVAPYPTAPSYGPPPAGYSPVAPPAYSSSYTPQNGVNHYPPQPQPPLDPKAQEAYASGSSYLPPGYGNPAGNPPPYDSSKKNQ